MASPLLRQRHQPPQPQDHSATNAGTSSSFSGPSGVSINGQFITAQLLPTVGGPPASINRAHNQGALIVDNAGSLWYCVTSGTPGTWRQLSGATTAGAHHPVTPGRIYDSRCTQPSPATFIGRHAAAFRCRSTQYHHRCRNKRELHSRKCDCGVRECRSRQHGRCRLT